MHNTCSTEHLMTAMILKSDGPKRHAQGTMCLAMSGMDNTVQKVCTL